MTNFDDTMEFLLILLDMCFFFECIYAGYTVNILQAIINDHFQNSALTASFHPHS